MSELSWSTQIDNYCERTDFSLWAEPVNALTNASFLIVAIIALVVARRAGKLDVGTGLLIGLSALIGVGSFLFHTLATRWAALADTLPILLFIVAYLALALRRFFQLGWGASIAIAFLCGGVSFLARSLSRSLVAGGASGSIGGSVGYLPAATALVIVATLLAWKHHRAARSLIGATLLFFLSLAFRTIDLSVCDAWPLGTHFLWHLLNGVLLGWLMLAMIRYGDGRSLRAR